MFIVAYLFAYESCIYIDLSNGPYVKASSVRLYLLYGLSKVFYCLLMSTVLNCDRCDVFPFIYT